MRVNSGLTSLILMFGWVVLIVSASQYGKPVAGADKIYNFGCENQQALRLNNDYKNNCTSGILEVNPRISVFLRTPVTISDLAVAAQEGKNAVRDLDTFERQLLSQGIIKAKRTACTIFFLQEPEKARTIFRNAVTVLETSLSLQRKLYLNPTEAGHGLGQHSSSICTGKIYCVPDAQYRTYDGSCNNMQYPSWGQTYSALQRLLPPNYSDGLYAFRKSVIENAYLPSTRLVTITAMTNLPLDLKDVSLIFMAWGQMLTHDFAHAPTALHENGSSIACCKKDGNFLPKELLHPWCAPIPLPAHDPFYAPLNQKCLGFVRSMLTLRPDCSLGHAEQMNQLTHWLDGSSMYGSSLVVANRLRSFSQGKLRVSRMDNRPFLPRRANRRIERPVCFDAGDSRVQEQFTTVVVNIILLREHNRIAEQLAQLNAHWSDERLYQESRKIVIAILQHVTYNEYLPILLGSKYAEENGITTPSQGYFWDYFERLNPSLVNEFGVAAFRMGHSQIRSSVPILDPKDQTIDSLVLRHTFEDSRKIILPGYFDGAIRGLTLLAAQRVDRAFTAEVTNHLFQGVNGTFGEDLISINMQRGRDHGVRSYNDYRVLCDLPRATCFSDLRQDIDPNALEGFAKVYASVDDIDLYAGAVSEFTQEGSLLGPTFHCIVADQFLRLRKGDRFFYDLGGQPHSFTSNQLQEIRKSSLARLFCDNSDDLKIMQPSAFRLDKAPNFRVPCDSSAIPRIDLNAWREY